MDEQSLREIEVALKTALSKRGIGGKVVVKGNVAELHHIDRSHTAGQSLPPAPTVVAIELEWVNQWNVLPPDLQAQRAELAARRLHNSLEEARGSKIRVRGDGPPLLPIAKKLVVPLLALVVVGLFGRWLYHSNFFGSGADAETAASATASPPDTPREQLACEAARKRMYAGASMGLDVAGWVVELWLARPVDRGKLAGDAAVGKALGRAPALAQGFGPAEVRVHAASDNAQLGVSSAVLELSGGHVTAFFDAKGREALEQFASALAHDAEASHAALYARCAHLAPHDVGAWYFGSSDAELGASLLYAAGAFAEPPAVDLDALSSGVVPLLSKKAAALDTAAFEEAIAAVGGKLVRSETDAGAGGSTVRFPLGGPTRAIKLSRALAKQLALSK